MNICSPWIQSEIQSNRFLWSTDIFSKWRSPPDGPTQANSKCFKIAVWPQNGGGPHTPSSVLLHISAGIVRIQKRSARTGRPFWLERTHNALHCCCELLTAWASGELRWGVGSRAEYLTFLRDDSLVTTLVSYCMHPLCVDLIWMTNTFLLWSVDCFGKLHPACTEIEAWAVIFKDCLTYAGRKCILQGHRERS